MFLIFVYVSSSLPHPNFPVLFVCHTLLSVVCLFYGLPAFEFFNKPLFIWYFWHFFIELDVTEYQTLKLSKEMDTATQFIELVREDLSILDYSARFFRQAARKNFNDDTLKSLYGLEPIIIPSQTYLTWAKEPRNLEKGDPPMSGLNGHCRAGDRSEARLGPWTNTNSHCVRLHLSRSRK